MRSPKIRTQPEPPRPVWVLAAPSASLHHGPHAQAWGLESCAGSGLCAPTANVRTAQDAWRRPCPKTCRRDPQRCHPSGQRACRGPFLTRACWGAPARRPSRTFLLTALKQRHSEPLRERRVPGAPACLALPGVLGAGWGACWRPQPQCSALAARVSRGRRALGELHEAAPARPPLRWAPTGSSGQELAEWLECGARPRRATAPTPAPSHLDSERERV
ncbi:uncharacterized protein LOC108310624 [Cebus imitator]|uniref:uncharacterized protein LOC108310624 n=1 Tax=Cebus imitator TaxID=2715852 RepID=UPI00189AD6E9|nr:uncharacterized protein LOC108310624 [Cebus imitator]